MNKIIPNSVEEATKALRDVESVILIARKQNSLWQRRQYDSNNSCNCGECSTVNIELVIDEEILQYTEYLRKYSTN